MKEFDTWEDICRYWTSFANEHLYKDTLKQIIPINIKVPELPDGETIYGYDWPEKSDLDTRVNQFISGIHSRWYASQFAPLNKGTLCTLEMLIGAKADEEKIAVWVYAFIHEYCRGRVCRDIEMMAYIYLKEHDLLWYHHAMKKLVPFVIPHSFLLYDLVNIQNESVLIDLALLNAYLIVQQYIPVLFYSNDDDLKGGEKDE